MVLFPLFVSAFQIALLGAATLTLALLLSDETETYQQHRLRVDHSSITAGLAELGANLEGLGYRIDLPPSLNASRIVDALPEVTLTARQLVLLQAGYVTFGAFWSFFFLNAIGIATVSGCVVCVPRPHLATRLARSPLSAGASCSRTDPPLPSTDLP